MYEQDNSDTQELIAYDMTAFVKDFIYSLLEWLI